MRTEETEATGVLETISAVTSHVLAASIAIHSDLGPGLLETVYEQLLAAALQRQGYRVERQRAIDLQHDGLHIANAFRADLIVEDTLLVEVKSLERLAPVHAKQVLTYLRLARLPVGLLINFGGETLKEGVKRLVNPRHPSVSSVASVRTTPTPDQDNTRPRRGR